MGDAYCWSDDEESFRGHFATREEAAAEAADAVSGDIEEGESRTIETALTVAMPLSELAVGAADALIERLAERAYEQVYEDAGELLENEVSKKAAEALQCKLEALIEQWAREYDVQPKLFTVAQVVEHVITVDGDTVLVDGEALP